MKSYSIPNHILIPEIKKAIDEGHTATFRVRGFSMRLFLEDQRDKVLLAPCTSVRKGDVILAEVLPQVYVLHRVIRMEGKQITLQGDGNIGTTEHCEMENVIGIATGFYRKGRTKPDLTSGWKWRAYSQIWLALTPLRRWILAIYRRQPFRI